MSRIDHAKHANQHLDNASNWDALNPDQNLMAAQVEATLALVEQQRIANLIALAACGQARVHPDIAAALGIEAEE